MIWESGPWKVELVRMVERSERLYERLWHVPTNEWTSACRDMQIERAVFMSAFIVRKLMDSGKLSFQVETCTIEATTHQPRDERIPDSITWEKIDRYYDLDSKQTTEVRFRDLLNWIIHTYVFVEHVESDHAGGVRTIGFYCNSDRTRGRELLYVFWNAYKRALWRVANDDVVEICQIRDALGNEAILRSAVPLTPEARAEWHSRHQETMEEYMNRWYAYYGSPDRP